MLNPARKRMINVTLHCWKSRGLTVPWLKLETKKLRQASDKGRMRGTHKCNLQPHLLYLIFFLWDSFLVGLRENGLHPLFAAILPLWNRSENGLTSVILRQTSTSGRTIWEPQGNVEGHLFKTEKSFRFWRCSSTLPEPSATATIRRLLRRPEVWEDKMKWLNLRENSHKSGQIQRGWGRSEESATNISSFSLAVWQIWLTETSEWSDIHRLYRKFSPPKSERQASSELGCFQLQLASSLAGHIRLEVPATDRTLVEPQKMGASTAPSAEAAKQAIAENQVVMVRGSASRQHGCSRDDVMACVRQIRSAHVPTFMWKLSQHLVPAFVW